jgi:PhnB protein
MSEQPQGVIPHLVVNGAAQAIEFYKKAFGATELMRVPAQDGKRLMHAALMINGAHVYLVDDFPEYREQCGKGKITSPGTAGTTTSTLHLEVPDCDAAVKRAADAGATVMMEPIDAFWGSRYAQVMDPFGHFWSFAHPLPAKQA